MSGIAPWRFAVLNLLGAVEARVPHRQAVRRVGAAGGYGG
jgi:hypothetical protein